MLGVWGCCKCGCLYSSSFVLCGSVWNSVKFFVFWFQRVLQSENEKWVWIGLAWYLPALNLDREPSFLCSDQARLKSRLLSYASCSVISRSSFFMIHIYRCYKMCVFLSLFIEPSYFSYLISYTSCIIVQNEWHICIHPSCTPCYGCVPCTIFWVFYLWQAHKEV